jgi:hypothetical protein
VTCLYKSCSDSVVVPRGPGPSVKKLKCYNRKFYREGLVIWWGKCENYCINSCRAPERKDHAGAAKICVKQGRDNEIYVLNRALNVSQVFP